MLLLLSLSFFVRLLPSSLALPSHLFIPTAGSVFNGQNTHTLLEKKTKTKSFSAALHVFSTGNSSCQRPCDAKQ